MNVRYTPRARNDLSTILSYIEQNSPQGARNVARAVSKTIQLIAEFPQSGRLVGEQGTRVLPVGRYPYLIYWSVKGGEAWILHIRHTARRPWQPGREPV
jgi:plasmid stabilization system protein ParE